MLKVQLEGSITRELQLARQLIAQKKQSQALIALKKKKIQEGRVDNIDKWLLNVEETVRCVRVGSMVCPANQVMHHVAYLQHCRACPIGYDTCVATHKLPDLLRYSDICESASLPPI